MPFERLSNTLEPVVLHTWPEVAATRDSLLRAGAPIVRMSGSGPTLFAPFRALTDAIQVYETTRQAHIESWLCHTISQARVGEALSSESQIIFPSSAS